MALKRGYIFLSILCLFIYACVIMDGKLKFINTSNSRIQIAMNYNFPDTSFVKSRIVIGVGANDSNSVNALNQKWEKFLANKRTVTLFVVSEDSLNKYSMESSLDSCLEKLTPLAKYTLTKEILDSMNWKLHYP